MNLYKCIIGQLTVVSFDLSNQVKHIYCGLQSNVINYSPYGMTKVEVSVKYRIQYELVILYSVLDYNVIMTCEVKDFVHSLFEWSFYIMHPKVFVKSFFFSFEKFQRIFFTISAKLNMSVSIYDGPGILSQILKPFNETVKYKSYLTTSFQALATTYDNFQNSESHFINFVKDDVQPCAFINTTNVTISFPIETCRKSFSVIEIYTITHYKINLTISYAYYIGVNNVLCNYAGLAAYDYQFKTHRVISSMCFQQNHSIYRNIYSKDRALLLVIYEYPEYGQLTVSLQGSSSQCKPVLLNICSFEYPCPSRYHKRCEHLQNVPNLDVYCDEKKHIGICKYRGQTHKANITVGEEGQCVVLQLGHEADDMTDYPTYKYQQLHDDFTGIDLHLCRIRELNIARRYQETYELSYTMSGLLSGSIFPFEKRKFIIDVSPIKVFIIKFD